MLTLEEQKLSTYFTELELLYLCAALREINDGSNLNSRLLKKFKTTLAIRIQRNKDLDQNT